MPIRRIPIVVLRFWHRLATCDEVRALAHPAFRWLYGLTMQWTGHNNGVIEFTRRRHAALYGLDHREVFERARRDVIGTGLVMLTRSGGPHLPAQYALATLPIQATDKPPTIGAPHVPMSAENDGAPYVPYDANLGASHAPTWDVSRPIKNDPHIKIARASEYGKEKSQTAPSTVTDSSVHTSSQKGDATEANGQPNGEATGKPPSVPRVSGSEVDQAASAERPASDSRQNGPNLRLVRVH
jgi:hypothetical protein